MKTVIDAFKAQKNAETIRPILLYSIQYDAVSNLWLRYTSWPTTVNFDGVTYTPFTVSHDVIKEGLAGRVDMVTMRLGNVSREIQAYLENYDGLRQKKIVIRLVWYDEIGNPNCYMEDTFYVEDSSSNQAGVELTLAPSLDVLDIKLPRRTFFRGYCLFQFQGTDCGYAGAESTCNKTLQRCRELNNAERYGGFPGIPMKRLLIR